MTDTPTALEQAALRSRVYGLLARALRPPDETEHAWLREEFLPAAHALAVTPDDLLAEDELPTLEQHRRDFHQLFDSHGPMTVTPYAIEYLKEWPQQSLLDTVQLADVQGFYRAFGLEVSQTGSERCDHVRLELEFLHFLGLKEAIALDREDAEHLEVVRHAQKRFLEDHAGRWPARFADAVERHDAPVYYCKLARLIRTWVETDMKMVGCTPRRPVTV
ncbi:MAG: molecular chaperone TorD family protein [Candidatus Sumerlaeia bacterium]|nr:molecular chaperone TorD family protein [Candidatus Sumerlaeia bacterium]